jgi:8-oxo-dGTP diphosphatase
MNFHVVKVALLVGDKLLLHLRDNKPGLFNANMWDFPGGGREETETPTECAQREIKEELGVELSEDAIIWQKEYPAQKDPNQRAYFMVATIEEGVMESITLAEGQEWKLFSQEQFFADSQVIEALKMRFHDYLNSEKL